MASAVLITNDAEFARAAAAETAARALRLPRRDIIEKSLSGYGAVFVTETIEEAFAASNAFAPEHLEICVEDPLAALSKITNAGAVFMGHYAPEPLGDYAAGPNHVLPTGGTPRFFSALSVDDFLKKTSVLSFTKRAMETISGDVIAFAEAEGLTAHAEAVRARLQ
jgi:histidinol dehydrogenase